MDPNERMQNVLVHFQDACAFDRKFQGSLHLLFVSFALLVEVISEVEEWLLFKNLLNLRLFFLAAIECQFKFGECVELIFQIFVFEHVNGFF